MIEIEEMKYKNLSEVKERINKNYEFIQQLESLIKDQATDMEKLMLITLVGYLYSLYITGQYASAKLEKELIAIGNRNIKFLPSRDAKKGRILIVMTVSANVGGHSVLVNNWIRWDNRHQYSVVFTEQEHNKVVEFIRESVDVSNGKIYCLEGDAILKAKRLLDISQNFEKILLFTNMHDTVPILAYGNRNWKIPVFFCNHADFRFSFGFSVADKVLNLAPYDKDKTERYRGVAEGKSVLVRFPNGGQIVGNVEKSGSEKNQKSKEEKKHILAEKFGFAEHEKLIVSAGAEFKYKNIVGFQFDMFVKTLLKKFNGKATFLIIGADKESDKWERLYEQTNGKGRAIGILPRKYMDELIEVADLYILSFPMIGAGAMVAEKAKVPYLALFITERGMDLYGHNAARTVDELLEKSLDVLNGQSDCYLGQMAKSFGSKEEWSSKWEKVLEDVKEHHITEICPKRLIETQEYVNCQLMQETASDNIETYINFVQINGKVRKKIYELDQKYEMGIFKKDIYENYNEKMALSDKHLKLYLTAIKWIQLKQKGKSIGSYLYKKGYRTVAIYGMSYMGESLVTELAGSQIEVRYGIDRNAQGLHSAVKVYQPEDTLEQVDIILNTTNIENWKILENMKEQSIPMLRFDEILGDME